MLHGITDQLGDPDYRDEELDEFEQRIRGDFEPTQKEIDAETGADEYRREKDVGSD